jgi:DNA-binding NarL/FixJ family response regulator
MRRVVIIGSNGFLMDAIPFALEHMPADAVFWVIDSRAHVEDEVRRSRADIIIVDGTTEADRASNRLAAIRAGAQDALLIVVVEDPDVAHENGSIEAGVVICAWPCAARRRSHDGRRDTWKPGGLHVARESGVGIDRGHAALTDRELETLTLVAEGRTNAFIAHKLWVTEQTVKFHLTNIFRKLHVANRTEATHRAIEYGLVPHPTSNTHPAGPAPTTERAASPYVSLIH